MIALPLELSQKFRNYQMIANCWQTFQLDVKQKSLAVYSQLFTGIKNIALRSTLNFSHEKNMILNYVAVLILFILFYFIFFNLI